MSIESDKRVRRDRIKCVLRSFNDEEILKKSEKVGLNLLKLLREITSDYPQRKLSTLGVYSPLRGEVDWRVKTPKNWQLAYPSFCEEAGLKFKAAQEGLVKNREFGAEVLAPRQEERELFPAICFIPGLAFSPKGERLGRGGGFYDRYLKQFRGVSIGLAFSEQVLESIPMQAHDELINFLVSENCIYWRGQPYKFQSSAGDI